MGKAFDESKITPGNGLFKYAKTSPKNLVEIDIIQEVGSGNQRKF